MGLSQSGWAAINIHGGKGDRVERLIQNYKNFKIIKLRSLFQLIVLNSILVYELQIPRFAGQFPHLYLLVKSDQPL
jgi:hypothetical protein